MGCVHCVPNDQVYVVEKCGKFDRAAHPGLLCLCPGVCRVSGKLSTRVMQLDVVVETKTLDNVFVQLHVSVQYAMQLGKVYEAHYRLQDRDDQIRSYVFDVVRSAVPRQTLDEAFESKDDIAKAIKEELKPLMDNFGYTIVQALVTDVNPDQHVKNAMNEINASKNQRTVIQEKAEAEKLLIIKRAQADAEAKYLQGEGIARQRAAIIEGLRESVQDFSSSFHGMDQKDVLDLVLITQYFDTLKELGAQSGRQTIFIPHNPGSLAQLAEEIRSGVIQQQPSNLSPGQPARNTARGPSK